MKRGGGDDPVVVVRGQLTNKHATQYCQQTGRRKQWSQTLALTHISNPFGPHDLHTAPFFDCNTSVVAKWITCLEKRGSPLTLYFCLYISMDWRPSGSCPLRTIMALGTIVRSCIDMRTVTNGCIKNFLVLLSRITRQPLREGVFFCAICQSLSTTKLIQELNDDD